MPQHNPSASAPPDLVAAVDLVSSFHDNPAGLHSWRLSQQRLLADAQRRLAPLSRSLLPHVPQHIRELPNSPDPLLLDALSLASGLPDASLGFSVLVGFVTVGDVPDTGLFRPQPRAASVRPARFAHRKWVGTLHRSILKRGARLTAPQRADACAVRDKTRDECRAVFGRRWARGPLALEELRRIFPRGFWPTRRFGVTQKGAVRPCDDCRESQQNAATSEYETITNSNAELPSAIAGLFAARLPAGFRLLGGTDDWRKAYRQCGARDPACQVVAQYDPDARDVEYAVLGGLEFGQLAAVNNFNWLAFVMNRSARLLFACCVGNYFDDYVQVEPDYAGATGQRSLLCLHERSGYLLDAGKHAKMASRLTFLGVSHDLSRASDGVVSLCILPERAARVSAVCESVVASGRLYPGQSSRLRGKLYFACTTAFGKVGRAALQPLVDRQFGPSRSSLLSPEEEIALRFFIVLLADMPPREVRIRDSPADPVLVWTDASSDAPLLGDVGFVVFDPDLVGRPRAELPLPLCCPGDLRPFSGFVFGADPVPASLTACLVPKQQNIGQYELLAGFAPYLSLPELLRGRDVMHWIDNTSAAAVLVRGYSGRPDSAHVANMFHLFNSRLRSRIYFEYVESKANVADLPSRCDYTLLSRMGALRVPLRLPRASEWFLPLSHWTSLASPAARHCPRTRVPGRFRRPPASTGTSAVA